MCAGVGGLHTRIQLVDTGLGLFEFGNQFADVAQHDVEGLRTDLGAHLVHHLLCRVLSHHRGQIVVRIVVGEDQSCSCLLYTSPSPRDRG